MFAEAKKDAETAQSLGSSSASSASSQPSASSQAPGGLTGWRKLERARTAPPEKEEKVIKMTFRVKATIDYGETLWVTGNSFVLGGWDTGQALQMMTRNSTYPVWTAECRLPAEMSQDLRYKYLIKKADGRGAEKWEDAIGDRVVSTRFMHSALMRGADNHVIEDGDFNKVPPSSFSPSHDLIAIAPPQHGQVHLAPPPPPPPYTGLGRPSPSPQVSSLAEAHMAQEEAQGDTLHTHEIPSAVSKRTGPSGSEMVARDAHSKGQQLVSFQVQVNTNYGEEVFLCGSDPCVGSWVPLNGIKMSTTAHVYPQWVGRLSIDRPIDGGQIAYKYVIKVPDGSWAWEDRIPDRKVSPSGLETVVHDGRFNQAQRQVTFVKLEGAKQSQPQGAWEDPQAMSMRRKIQVQTQSH